MIAIQLLFVLPLLVGLTIGNGSGLAAGIASAAVVTIFDWLIVMAGYRVMTNWGSRKTKQSERYDGTDADQ